MQEISPGTVIDGLRIDTVAGRGGSSVVYRATDLGTGAPLALKVLSRADPSARRQLVREAELLSTVDHPGIVPFRGLHHTGDHDVLITDWVEGESLRDRRDRLGPLDVDQAIGILEALAPPLDHLHSLGIIHRDISPSNVLIGPDGTVTLIDLGIGHFVESTTLTSDDLLAGTPSYLAPEVIRGERADGHADQYSVGVLLHELLTGRSPFPEAGQIATALHHQLHSAPTPLDEIDPRIPTGLADAVLRSLAKEPTDRFPSMADFVAAALGAAAPPLRSPTSGAGPVGADRTGVGHAGASELPADSRPNDSRSGRTVLVIGAALAALLVGAVAVISNASPDDRDQPEAAVDDPSIGNQDETETEAGPGAAVETDTDTESSQTSAIVVSTTAPVSATSTSAPSTSVTGASQAGIPGPGWTEGDGARLSCNRLQASNFTDGALPIEYFGEPPERERVVDGLGFGRSRALEIGLPGAFGQYGEIVPVVPGESYSFIAWVTRVGEIDDTEMGISFLGPDYQPLVDGDKLDDLPVGPEFLGVVDVQAPQGAGFAVPYLYKDGSPGVLIADELIFGLAGECRTQIEAR